MDRRRRLPLWHPARHPVLVVPSPGVPFRLGIGRRRRIPARHRGLPLLPPGSGLLADLYPRSAGFHDREIQDFRIGVAFVTEALRTYGGPDGKYTSKNMYRRAAWRTA